MPATSASSAAGLESRSGAKPPSSPTAVERPCSCSHFFRAWKISVPVRSASAKLGAPTGTIMNSWKSTLLSAWAPPLSTFIIGTGQHVGLGTAQVAPQRLAGVGRSGLGHRQRDAQQGVGAQAALVVGAVEVDHRPVQAGLVGGLAAGHLRRDLAVDVLHRLGDALAAPGLAAVAQLDGLELAGGGARGHRPRGRRRPERRVASTSTVGLPRLSRTWRAWREAISLIRARALCISPEAIGGGSQRQLGVHAVGVGGLHRLQQRLAVLLERATPARLGLVQAGAGGPPQRLVRVERRGQVLGQVAEHLSPALVLALDAPPLLQHRLGGLGSAPRRTRAGGGGSASRGSRRPPRPGHRRRAPRPAAPGSGPGTARPPARRSAWRRLPSGRRRPARRPPRPCGARSSARPARGPRDSRGAGAA